MNKRELDAILLDNLSNYHENDISELLKTLTSEERKRIYQRLGTAKTAAVFTYFDEPEIYLDELSTEHAARLISRMDSDDAVDILERLNPERKKEIVQKLESHSAQDVKLLLSYEDNEIGSCMTTNYICIQEGRSVRQAMNELIQQAGTLIEHLVDYAEDSIPVLNENKQLLGVITPDDMIEIVNHERNDDYAKLGGLTAEEDLTEPTRLSIKKRLPWLMILLLLGMLVSSVVGVFEGVAAAIPIVICFQSLVLDMAGNVGTQSLAVTIRVLMDENITGKQKLLLLGKEMKIGLFNGGLLGILAFTLLGIYIHITKHYAWSAAFSVSGCVGLALLAAMVISSLVGTAIPMLFHKIHIDPAVASGPLITTVNDLVAVISYYGLAYLVFIK